MAATAQGVQWGMPEYGKSVKKFDEKVRGIQWKVSESLRPFPETH